MKKKIALGTLAVVLIATAVFVVPTVWFKPWSIDHFYGRVFLQFALRHPVLLSRLRILEPWGLDFHSDELDDVSVEARLAEARWLDRQIKILRSYDRGALDEEGRLSYDVFEWFADDAQRNNLFLFHNYPVNQFEGVQSMLPDFMIEIHQINDEDDAENYLARLAKFDTFFDQVVDGLRHRQEQGIIPPRFVLRRVLDEMRGLIADEVTESPLYQHFADAVAGLEGVSEENRQQLLRQAEETIATVVYPAYGRLIAFTGDLEQIASTDDGVWKLPQGDAFYAQALRHHTTTEKSADEIHQLGLAEVARIRDEMRQILVAEGLPADDVGATMQQLGEDPRFLYPATAAGRQKMTADYQAIVDDINARLPALFNLRPKAGVVVKRMLEFREPTHPVAYYDPPPLDGSRPGTFYLNLRGVKEHPKFGMRTLAYHEAIPGHHFQIALAFEQEGVPFFRRIIPFTAFIEGWALYAEQLADEYGFLDDPYDRLGYLQSELLRAVRLVVDTGIHHRRWTREEAIDYMRRQTGMVESDVVVEVERYIVNPGQACAYKVGEMRILELRDRARTALGEDFDLREFHDVILGHGAVPLVVLDRLVDDWIAKSR